MLAWDGSAREALGAAPALADPPPADPMPVRHAPELGNAPGLELPGTLGAAAREALPLLAWLCRELGSGWPELDTMAGCEEGREGAAALAETLGSRLPEAELPAGPAFEL